MPVNEEMVLRVLLAEQVKLLGYLQAIVHDPHIADDLFQEVSLHALKHRDKINDQAHLLRWLRQVACHQAIDHLRQQRRQLMIFDKDLEQKIEQEWSAMDDVSTHAMLEALNVCLDKLSPYGRKLIQLRYSRELTGPRLAKALHRSVNTVSVALSRVHRVLFNCMQKQLAEKGGVRV